MECHEVICISDDDMPPEMPENTAQKPLVVPIKKRLTLSAVKPVTNQFIKMESGLSDDERSKITNNVYDEGVKPMKKDIITRILNLCYANVESTADVLILNKMSKKLVNCDASNPEFIRFAQKIRSKIKKDPSSMHVHLKELYVEVKAMRKVRIKKEVVVKREYETDDVAMAATANYLPDLVTSHSRAPLFTASNLPSCSFSPSSYERDKERQQPSTSQDHRIHSETKIEYRIRKITNLLKACNKKIVEYEERDLSLDDLDDDDSCYVRLHKYKTKSLQCYKALCRLTGRSTKTGRITENKFKFDGSVSGTRYEEINRQIANLVNVGKRFPNFRDVFKVVKSCNESENLHLRPTAVETLAREVFRDIGQILKKRRIDDFREDFGSYLTDSYVDGFDPADGNEEMEKKLRENKEEAKIKIEEIFDDYTKKQVEMEKSGVNLEDEDDEEEEEGEEEGEESTVELTDDETESEAEMETQVDTKETETMEIAEVTVEPVVAPTPAPFEEIVILD